MTHDYTCSHHVPVDLEHICSIKSEKQQNSIVPVRPVSMSTRSMFRISCQIFWDESLSVRSSIEMLNTHTVSFSLKGNSSSLFPRFHAPGSICVTSRWLTRRISFICSGKMRQKVSFNSWELIQIFIKPSVFVSTTKLNAESLSVLQHKLGLSYVFVFALHVFKCEVRVLIKS